MSSNLQNQSVGCKPKRSNLSKKVRFDVFKRDRFVCQYCGAHPPSTVLEVDHITPVCEGGGNGKDNLITACFNCNRGKAGTPLSVVPVSLAAKAAEVAEREEQVRGYAKIMADKRDRLEADCWRVFAEWRGQKKTTHLRFKSVKKFVEVLGLDEVLDAVEAALCASIKSDEAEFRYFCGVCWNKIRASTADG